jgi:hypothetical protein
VITDTAFTVLTQHNIPVNADTRRWFQQGRTDRGLARSVDATKQGEAFRRLLGFRSWGNAARCAGWLFEHRARTQPVQARARILTRSPGEAQHFAHIIASRHGECI